MLSDHLLWFLEVLLSELTRKRRNQTRNYRVDSLSIAADREIFTDKLLEKVRRLLITCRNAVKEVLTQTYDLICAGIVLSEVGKELKDRVDTENRMSGNRLIKFLSGNAIDCVGIESNLKVSVDHRVVLILLKNSLLELT
jgi:hypothetical protein